MAETKKITHWGWVTAEKQMIKKLEKCAAEGWIPDSNALMGYKIQLKRLTPQKIQYAVDWKPCIEDEMEYLAIYKAAGWDLALKEKGGFYVFSAQPGAVKPYTDREELQRLRKERLKRFGLYSALYLAICAALLVFVRIVALPLWGTIVLCIPGAFCAANLGVSLVTTISLAIQQNDF